MHRNELLGMLEKYATTYPEETECVQRFQTFVVEQPHCFERSLSMGHVTGSAWLVDMTQTKTLLTHHRKLNMWVQLGGHADGNSHVQDVALQEAYEESGLSALQLVSPDIFDLDIHEIPARKHEPAHLHYDVRFAIQSMNEDSFQVSEESHDLAWILVKELSKKSQEESMLRMQAKWLNR